MFQVVERPVYRIVYLHHRTVFLYISAAQDRQDLPMPFGTSAMMVVSRLAFCHIRVVLVGWWMALLSGKLAQLQYHICGSLLWDCNLFKMAA